MKKSFIFLLVLTLAFSAFLVGCTPKDTPTDTAQTDTPADDTPAEDTSAAPTSPCGQLIIGNGTELSGDWSPRWKNGAADYDIWHLITGAETVEMTFEGQYVINESVVEKHDVTKNEDGSKTHTFTIKDGLVYNDGTPVTAKDYVASVVFWSSKLIGDMGANNDVGYYYKGWEDFSKGNSKVFSGVNLIDEKTFAITIAAESLPFFHELSLASVEPLKLSYWTDDKVEIKDDGEGCYFSDNFTLENYEAKISEARMSIHLPSTGPYAVESYDESTKTAVLQVNENYCGDYSGQKPMIQTIIYKLVNEETQYDELSTGAVDLLNGMASGNEINAGLDLVDKGGFSYTTYPRNGYGKIHFVCDCGPTQFKEVRQAIGHLLDRNDFAKAFTGGFGSTVNGPYGEALWFYQETKAELNEKLNQYPYSLEAAVKLLEDSGWIYDEKGNEYKEGIRYKKLDDGTLMPLIIEWCSSEQNPVSDLLVVKLQENPDVAAAGMQINQTTMTFSELLNYMYRDGATDPKYSVPTYNMFNLGTGFTADYDQSKEYPIDPDQVAAGNNQNFLIDEELYNYAKEMILVEPGDNEEYKKRFVKFIDRWNELLPDLPLYSNIYHDFYNKKLKNYRTNDMLYIDSAILYSYVEE